ncbi:H-NS histone family protein [Paraburkholderia bannensis]|uniref:H-NS histone family protein n=1 Tax=Paraburkholderia bannensis TaxID=765414 RepID=UPI002AB6A155|nr:H-NS histone family protein [Paraburkholderia bannensis]
MPSYKQLTAQLEKLHKEVAAAREKEVEQAIAEIKEKIAEYDITAEELGFTSAGAAAARKKTPLPARYANPKTGETWSGRGRAPSWLAGVKNRDRFLIQQ